MSVAASLRELYRNRRADIAAAVRDRPRDTYEKIGREFGITRERVRQIAKLHGVDRRPQLIKVCPVCMQAAKPTNANVCDKCGLDTVPAK